MGLILESERSPRSSHFQTTNSVEYASSPPDDICVRVACYWLLYLPVCSLSVVAIPNSLRNVTLSNTGNPLKMTFEGFCHFFNLF
jgi:hypothetical protein